MNLYNPGEVEERRIYYGNSYEAPRVFFDGELENSFDDIQVLSNIVGQSVKAGALSYMSYSNLTFSTDSLFVDIDIKNFERSYESAVCMTVLTEDSIHYMGTNGETIHNQAMRDLTFTQLVTFNPEITLTHSLKLSPDFSLDERFHLVTFIQDAGTREILQAIDRSMSDIK